MFACRTPEYLPAVVHELSVHILAALIGGSCPVLQDIQGWLLVIGGIACISPAVPSSSPQSAASAAAPSTPTPAPQTTPVSVLDKLKLVLPQAFRLSSDAGLASGDTLLSPLPPRAQGNVDSDEGDEAVAPDLSSLELSQCLPPAVPATVFPSSARHVLVRLLSLALSTVEANLLDGVYGPLSALERSDPVWENASALCSMASDVLLHYDAGVVRTSDGPEGTPDSSALSPSRVTEFVQVVEDEKWKLRLAVINLWDRLVPWTCGVSDIGVSLESARMQYNASRSEEKRRERSEKLAQAGIDAREEHEREDPALEISARNSDAASTSAASDGTASSQNAGMNVVDLIDAALGSPMQNLTTPSIEQAHDIMRSRTESSGSVEMSMAAWTGEGVPTRYPSITETQRPSPPMGVVVSLCHVVLLNVLKTLRAPEGVRSLDATVTATVDRLRQVFYGIQVAIPPGFYGMLSAFPVGKTEAVSTLVLVVLVGSAASTIVAKFPDHVSTASTLWTLGIEILSAARVHEVLQPEVRTLRLFSMVPSGWLGGYFSVADMDVCVCVPFARSPGC
jgi:hypothetical protein